jgi:hypothetical protein
MFHRMSTLDSCVAGGAGRLDHMAVHRPSPIAHGCGGNAALRHGEA